MRSLRLRTTLTLALCATALTPAAALARGRAHDARRGDPGVLLLSGSQYRGADITPGVTVLPPGCTSGCATATNDGTYPYVFNNDLVDSSFGVTAPIFLDALSGSGHTLARFWVPTDRLVTSFPSKSELALNLSTTGLRLSFMGYVAPSSELDVSNSNTPGVIDPTNPEPSTYYRAAAVLDPFRGFTYTETNAYSGNNGRAAILNDSARTPIFYTAGNAGNGGNPQPAGVIEGAGAQTFPESFAPESAQAPGPPTPLASFNISQLGDKPDKVGKDDNFRGLTEYGNVVYYSKGSGGNGVNTVYFVDTTGHACPNGTGLPAAGAPLPTSPLAYDPTTVQANGLPSNMCVLRGFPTTSAKAATAAHPFGMWFANPTTLYVADEGDGVNTYDAATNTYTDAAAQTTAGLQKWVFDPAAGQWNRVATLSAGLGLGVPYTVPGYPAGDNSATGLPWAPATDGLRNITGRVNRDGTVTVWAVTSTVSGGGDEGADPNRVVSITDRPSATGPGSAVFTTVRTADAGEVLRGVAFADLGGRERELRRGR